MFFSRDDDKSGSKAPKKRSLLGQLFNPNVGTEIKPVFESGRMFVRMLAYILASYKLFPKDHPALNDTSLKLSLGDVIGTAYRRLSFTREGIPQIILFVAVFGCLLFSALFIVTLLLSLFMGSAHAADSAVDAADSAVTSIFQSPYESGGSDWGLNWINYLFSGTAIPQSSNAVPQPMNCEIQTALAGALGIYSSAVLVLAGFLLLYHLVFMVAEQAHTGKIMGKANQIWAPIRLVFAIGMLVPITSDTTTTATGTCSGTMSGYNTAQYAVVQVARWGSGLASNIWSNFYTTLQSAQLPACTAAATSAPSCIKPAPDYRQIVRTLIGMDACTYFFTKYIQPYNQMTLEVNGYAAPESALDDSHTSYEKLFEIDNLSTLPFSINSTAGKFLGIKLHGTDGLADYKDFFLKDSGRLCGGYIAPYYVSTAYDRVRKAQFTAIDTIADTVHSEITATYAPLYLQGNPDDATIKKLGEDVQALIDSLQTDVETRVSTALIAADAAVLLKYQTDLKNSTNLTAGGWLTAASWFTSIIKIQAARSDAVRSAMPVFVEPSVFRLADEPRPEVKEKTSSWFSSPTLEKTGAYGVPKSTANSLSGYMDAIDEAIDNLPATAATLSGIDMTDREAAVQTGSGASSGPIQEFLAYADRLFSKHSIWQSGVIGLRFGMTSNPLAEITAFGQSFVTLAVDLMTYAAGGTILSAVLPFLGVVSSFMFALAMLLFTTGVTLGYVVPLYPFYRFFFGSLKWIMSVMEAIVLAPLFALAHVEPQGEGLAGKNARYGYSVLMQILLRPVLMIFGLIVGHLLFVVTIAFLNDAFIYAVKGTGAFGGDVPTIGKILYTVIYAALVLILANQCYSTIGLFPQVVLSWLGMQGVKEESIGDTGMLTTAAGAAAAHTAGKIPGLVGGAKGYISSKMDEREKNRVAGIGATRHAEMIEALGGGRAGKQSQIQPPSSGLGAGGGPHGGGAVAVQGGAADDYGSATSGNATQMPPDSIPGSNYTPNDPYSQTPSVGSTAQSDFKADIPKEKQKADPKLDKQQQDWLAKTDGGKKTPDDWNSGA